MCKIKYYLFLSKNYPQFFVGTSNIFSKLKFLNLYFMHPNDTKKNLTLEINKEQIKKSKFEVLTYENDFLVRNLKKA